MYNKIRVFILILVVGLLGLFGSSLLKEPQKSDIPIKIKSTSKGIDVEMENFKVTHEVLGRRDWELEAKLAQVDKENNTIQLNNVNVTLNMSDQNQSTISADQGVLNSETRDIELIGNVHFVADANQLLNRFRQSSESEKQE